MNVPDSGPNPLSFELLDTRQCLAIGRDLNEFENMVFGPDFSSGYECFRRWAESGCLFYSAVSGEAVAGRRTFLSVASVLLTDGESCERLLRGEINDTLIPPWPGDGGGEPVAYLSSVISSNRHHLAAIYDSLAEELCQFLAERHRNLQRGFCVATGPAGFRHLSNGGFVAAEGPLHLGKYVSMSISPKTAQSTFWRRVFGLLQAPLDSDPNQMIVGTSTPVPEANESHDVERRLAAGKRERYRHLLDL